MTLSQAVEVGLGGWIQQNRHDQRVWRRVGPHWCHAGITLTKQTLPGMAAAQRWPIRLDHCFMRVCLDTAIGQQWDTEVRRPATRHLTDAQLARAVDVAETIVRDPALLPALNAGSLAMRRRR